MGSLNLFRTSYVMFEVHNISALFSEVINMSIGTKTKAEPNCIRIKLIARAVRI